jgi:hypothetical protein
MKLHPFYFILLTNCIMKLDPFRFILLNNHIMKLDPFRVILPSKLASYPIGLCFFSVKHLRLVLPMYRI